jgi:hypothetical protein
MLPMAGEYTGGVMKEGITKFIARYRPGCLRPRTAPARSSLARAETIAEEVLVARLRSAPAAPSVRSSLP